MATCKQRSMPDPLTVLRCKVCSVHTDIRCSGCRNPICRQHNAAPSTSLYCYCPECRRAQVLAQKRKGGAMNERQRQVCAWAHTYLHQSKEWIIVDTETTGLGSTDEVIELAIVKHTGEVLFSSLIQPQDPKRPEIATHVHGITHDMLAHAPTFPEIWPLMFDLFQRFPVALAYNADYDARMLIATAGRYGYRLPGGGPSWTCLMAQYALYHGAWSDSHQSFTWQRLQDACTRLGVQVDENFHRATADALSTLGVLRALAALHQPQQESEVR
jgi:DNA polymerase III epsilon subunit-like protein